MKTFSIYGPPGTGKTSELLRRMEAAKQEFKVSQIGFLSFTKAGANEALKRLGIARSDKISTIHSLMYRLNNCIGASVIDIHKLRAFGLKAGFRFRGQATDTGEQMEIGDQFLSVLSKARNRMADLRDEYHESDRPGDWASFEFFCKSFESWKEANGFIDFNDMLSMYLREPKNHGASILFIDEAQDLSNLQWRVIDAMLKFESVKQVHIAGDDDQAIFEWSGANTHGMLEFEQRYDSARSVLEQSWRVPQAVYELAMRVAGTIENRVEKLYQPRDAEGIVSRTSMFDPKAVTHGEDVLILCRSYLTKKSVEDELIRHRIPYKTEGGYGGLFSSRLAEGIRVFNRMVDGQSIGQVDIDRLSAVADDRTRKEIQAKNFMPMLKRGYLRSFIIPPSLVDFYRDADFTQEPTIRLSTIHSAKGREAERVILHTGLTEKTLRDMDKDQRSFDAEARVWYTGVTRAKQKLEILEGDDGYKL